MVAPLGTHIDDPLERLRFVHDRTTNSKAMTEAVGARNMTEASKVSPALWMSLGAQLYTRLGLANRGMAPMFSTVVTNVPGPPVPIYSTGARLESMFGLLCLTDGMGLGHTVQSYVDEATVTFTACRELMPDPEFYAECIGASFAELRDAASGARTAEPGSTAPPPKPATRKAPARGTKPAAKRSPVKPKPTTPRRSTATKGNSK
jgi:diacylglycerol O-acyltransferase